MHLFRHGRNMQHTCYTNSAGTFSSFDLDQHETYARGDDYPDTLAVTPKSQLLGTPAPHVPAVPTVCLSLQPPRNRLDQWSLILIKDESNALTPDHIIGASVKIAKGRTSPIAAIDPATRRVRTLSGSIYELGVPDARFYNTAPDLVRFLGFL
jgi:hypothetical protein